MDGWKKYRKWRIAWAVALLGLGIVQLIGAMLGRMDRNAADAVLSIAVGAIAIPDWSRRVLPTAAFILFGAQKVIVGSVAPDVFSYVFDSQMAGQIYISLGIFVGLYEVVAWRRESTIKGR